MPRRSLALSGLLVLAACGPSDTQVAGAVLLFAPLVYLLSMGIVVWLYAIWKSILPDLRFGGSSHAAALALLTGPAIYGAPHADLALIGGVLVVFGACLLAVWLVLARLTVSSGWGFRWGGLVAAALLVAPMLVGLLWREMLHESLGVAMAMYVYGGGLGLVPGIVLVVTVIEGVMAARAVRARGADAAR